MKHENTKHCNTLNAVRAEFEKAKIALKTNLSEEAFEKESNHLEKHLKNIDKI